MESLNIICSIIKSNLIWVTASWWWRTWKVLAFHKVRGSLDVSSLPGHALTPVKPIASVQLQSCSHLEGQACSMSSAPSRQGRLTKPQVMLHTWLIREEESVCSLSGITELHPHQELILENLYTTWNNGSWVPREAAEENHTTLKAPFRFQVAKDTYNDVRTEKED